MNDSSIPADTHPTNAPENKVTCAPAVGRAALADYDTDRPAQRPTAAPSKATGFIDELRIFAEQSAAGQTYPQETVDDYIAKMRKLHIAGKLAETMFQSPELARLVLRHRKVSSKLLSWLQARFGDDITK